jgi:diguanylate cyclase (GGDEF)-like protein/PAS domain S-box-containing protein
MLLLHVLPQQSFLTEAFIDATLLVTLISPTLYYFLFKPMVTHISERQQVEDMLLRNKEQQFKTMIRASLDSFWITNLQGRFVEVNNAYCQLMGYSLEELLHMGIADVKVTDDTQDISRNINRIIEKGSDRFETRHRCKDGRILDFMVSANYSDLNGGVIYCFLRDITEQNLMEDALLESEDKFRSMSTHTHDAMIMMDDSGNISFWNTAAEKIFGYSAREVMGKELHTFIAPAIYYDAFKKVFGHFRATGEGGMVGKTRELMALRKGGAEFPVELALSSLKLKNKWYAVGIVRDITERKQAEAMLHDNESRLIDMFEHLSSGVAIYRISPDLQNFTITSFNRAAEGIVNMRREELIGINVLDAFPGIKEFGLLDVFRRVFVSGKAEHFPVSFYQDGRISGWRENYVYKLPNGEIVAIFDDVTQEKQAEERMHHLAHYDALTGLPNRALFSDRLQQAIVTAKREKTRVALLFIDLDKFKPVNDNLGHDVGDLLLKEVAKRMRNCVRDADTVSRIGGDEFVILLPSIELRQHAMVVAEKILHAINLPFELAGNNIHISSSIGVAVYPEHGGDEKLLTKNTDLAMYHAKNNGRNNVQLFTPDMANE